MKIGRLNSRVVDGPIRFPTGPKDLMVKVEEVFDAFFQIWNISCVPKLIPQPKWFKESPELKPDDVVYFQKRESDLTSKWTIGQVDSVIRSKDGAVRRANVRFTTAVKTMPGSLTEQSEVSAGYSMWRIITSFMTWPRWRT